MLGLNDTTTLPPLAVADGATQLLALVNLLADKGAAKLLADISKQAKAVHDANVQLAKDRAAFDEHQRAEHQKLEAASAAHARQVAEARAEHDDYLVQQRADIAEQLKAATEKAESVERDRLQAAALRAEMKRRLAAMEGQAA